MKCPICQKEMQEGYLEASSHMIFTKKRHTFFLRKQEEDLMLAEHVMTLAHVSAYHCEDCDHIILPDVKQQSTY